ncbi:MAG TPA: radical SAM protein [Candidatus Thermoplasmatota archaeon]|nr:radical SAM protein [Candidatus Thermoplasmatota archaeon]
MKINEIFYSLQGEGSLAGLPTVFIRTTGCNLRCSYCDTTYAYEEGHDLPVDQILRILKSYNCSSVCITGGEPLLQKDLKALLTILLRKRYTICIETNGSKSITPLLGKKNVTISLDIKCPSSGMHQQMDLRNINALSTHDQLKFIIKRKEDYEYAKHIIKTYQPRCIIFFQPVWGTDPRKLSTWILHDRLPVRLGLQLHKILWGEKKGV